MFLNSIRLAALFAVFSCFTTSSYAGSETFEGELRFDEARILKPTHGAALLERAKISVVLKTNDILSLENISSEIIESDDPCDYHTYQKEIILNASAGSAMLGVTIEGSGGSLSLLPVELSATQTRNLENNDNRLFSASQPVSVRGSVADAIQYTANMTQSCGQTRAWKVEITAIQFLGSAVASEVASQVSNVKGGFIQISYRAYPADQLGSDPMELIEGFANLRATASR